MGEKSEVRVKFEIGEIKFEAEGTADLVERERSIFNNTLLPAAIDAIVRTRSVAQVQEQYIEPKSQYIQFGDDKKQINSLSIQTNGEDYSRTTLASFIKRYGILSEQDFVLFSAYFDEIKNHASHFTKDETEKYYDDARRTKPQNISMCLNQLAQKGFIIDATDVGKKLPKPYRISDEGLEYINTYVPKDLKEKKAKNKSRKQRTKEKSVYCDINCDELNLNSYPSIKSIKEFKEKMMLILYIITNEKKGDWFSTTDVLCLLTDIFGETANKDQVNGVFRREKVWFKADYVDGNGKVLKRKLLNQGIDYAKSICAQNV